MHVTYLGVRRDRATAAAYRDERTVPALFLVWAETLESLGNLLPPGLFTAVDVSGGLRVVAREPGARVERTVGTDRVRVPAMNLTRTHVDAVGRREAALACLVAEV